MPQSGRSPTGRRRTASTLSPLVLTEGDGTTPPTGGGQGSKPNSLSAVAPPARRGNQIFYPPSLQLRRISVSLKSLTQEKLRLPGEGTTNVVIVVVVVVIVDLQAVSIKDANADAAAKSHSPFAIALLKHHRLSHSDPFG